MFKLENVSKVYKIGTFGGKELTAVDGINFEIQDGEVVSLIGESGSGKSTIGKMILRLISVTDGAIWLDGVDVSTIRKSELKEYYRKVQGVFQDPSARSTRSSRPIASSKSCAASFTRRWTRPSGKPKFMMRWIRSG